MKDISEMTVDELNALPEYQEFYAVQYAVRDDGTVALPNGTTVRGLTPGALLNIPHQAAQVAAYFVEDTTPLMWKDETGEFWSPVKLLNGNWMKRRA